jgi:hypothetical protein
MTSVRGTWANAGRQCWLRGAPVTGSGSRRVSTLKFARDSDVKRSASVWRYSVNVTPLRSYVDRRPVEVRAADQQRGSASSSIMS